MKLAALCCTYLRPELLGRLIESYLRQDYPAECRELVILDDAGQYSSQEGDGWRLISIPRRFNSLGEKRNACASLASRDMEGFLIADDDDVYLPHWFTAHAECLRDCEWSRPSIVMVEAGPRLITRQTDGLYHASWAYRREIFYRAGGYRAMNNGEDQDLGQRFLDLGAHSHDPCRTKAPFFICGVHTGSYHLSYMEGDGYSRLETPSSPTVSKIQIGWPCDYSALPVESPAGKPPIAQAADGLPIIELIRKADRPGVDGPHHGMYSLQKLFNEAISNGIDWLRVTDEPSGPEIIPWFWHWGDRGLARRWNAEGRSFISGPNMVFLNSRSPRCDKDECALLDAQNCKLMFCHSEWYRDLIEAHRGPANRSPVTLWSYPIDAEPGPPLPEEFALLIYEKNGVPARLVERLRKRFPRHAHFRYGNFTREDLIDAARRSRACAYLADDDHGALALSEILLSGCPVVGVRTGAPFVQQGLTGLMVSTIPSGDSESEAGGTQLADYIAAIEASQCFCRNAVHQFASEQFSKTRIRDIVIAALQNVRRAEVKGS